uniref:Basement membrane-specific heparan sulfate proteoglycan core protein n=1 Tax=Bubo bubo TaxID=30461 RepID=A0A8C0EF99_BUBBB
MLLHELLSSSDDKGGYEVLSRTVIQCNTGDAVCEGKAFPWRLFPAVLNLATNALITTNATCGEKGREMYCKLVEHVPGQPARNPQCRICDQRSRVPHQRHPITNAIDGKNTWWQSPSIQNGIEYHYVTITLDLQQIFQIAYVIVKAANSPRPGNWILERSLDGVDYQPWQYYAITDSECLTRYNIHPRPGTPSYIKDDEVICTSYYSKIHPLENGEIHTSLINGRPSADDPSHVLLEFTSARFIRLRFQRIRTLNADLMMFAHKDPNEIDPIVTRRYYYSIKDISVGGMCICSGHAKACPLDPATNKSVCQCEHNTCGETCDQCCPGFNQKPWHAGTFLLKHECEPCNCHGKTEDCYYDQDVADRNQSLNVHGEYIGGGVCVNCTSHTSGINCETCVDGYFRPKGVLPDSPDPCQPCSCDPNGSLHDTCVKDEKHGEGDMLPGFCHCKTGYAGESCNRCALGYIGYPECLPCNCSVKGSVNADPCVGPCICKELVEGENCDRCKPGFFNLQQNNPKGCEECFCSGKTNICTHSHLTYRNVRKIIPYHQKRFDGHQQFSISNVAARKVLPQTYYWSAPSSYLGNKVTAAGGHLKFTVSYDFTEEEETVQLMVQSDVIIEGGDLRISTLKGGIHLQPSEEHTEEIVLKPESFSVHGTDVPVSRREFMTILADVKRILIRATYSHGMNSCWPQHRRVNGTIFGGVCAPCTCFGHAELCDDITGECLDCKHNTGGPYCDRCLPGFYGDPTKGTAEDCQLCACPLSMPSNNFSPTCHFDRSRGLICNECPAGYVGPRCERCAEGYFGQPLIPGRSCQPCQCNDNLDFSVPGSCDSLSGACLICKPGTTGQYCERCAEGYYGDALDARNCQPCHCHINGSFSEICDSRTGQCECKANVIGRRCDTCKPETFGLQSSRGCVPCNCNSFGSKSFDCDGDGQCYCQPGVTGKKCDRCAHGFYNFEEGGCTPCECSRFGNNCDPVSGHCICPPNTVGEMCDKCAPNYWGHDIVSGCKPCECSLIGALSSQCDLNTGCCFCRPEFSGDKCTECRLGYWNYPRCVACQCFLTGTDPQSCDTELGKCSCVDHTGQCSCKVNVEGVHCDRCKSGTFGLSARNPLGCSSCYCFGLTTQCSEARGLIRMWVTLKPEQIILPLVDEKLQRSTLSGIAFQPPEIVANIEQVIQDLRSEPVYWRLPEQFEGQKLTAYGGKLKYAIYFEAREETGFTTYYPQVIIRGGPSTHTRIIVRHMAAPLIGQLTRHEIEMTEVTFPSAFFPLFKTVSREDFLNVLYDIHYILIKATHGNIMRQSRFFSQLVKTGDCKDELAMLPIPSPLCNDLFSSASFLLQSCSPGFYRLPSLPVGRTPAQSLGACVVCQCHGHSTMCDSETSICQNCQHNTAGHHCERCALGFYGIVQGSPGDCQPCACPLSISSNNFSPSCVAEGPSDYRCTACPPGYEGRYCERCSSGYVGNPQTPGGSCQECECDQYGSLPVPCDPVTGQCTCKPGFTGWKCVGCEHRHARDGMKCISCDDECTGLLLSDLNQLNQMILTVNLSGPLPAPYKTLTGFENMTQELKVSCVLLKVTLRFNLEAYFLCMLLRICRLFGVGNMNSVPSWMVMYCRNAEDLLDKVKKLFGEPSEKNEDLKNEVQDKLANYNTKVDDARDLLREAMSKIREADHLSAVNQKNMTMVEVSPDKIHKGLQSAYIQLHFSPFFSHFQYVEGVADKIQPMSDQLKDKIDDLSQEIHDRMLPEKVLQTENHAAQLNESSEADRLLDKIKPIKELQDNLGKNISQIKELINQARKQANSIKVSVSSGGNCIRTYRPEIKKGTYNTIIVNVKTVVADNLLFYLGSTDFLAIEMRKGKVSFLWDVGSGVGRVEYPDLTIDDGFWYRIEASRQVYISISRFSLDGPKASIVPATFSAVSPPGYTILDVDANAMLFVGGLTEKLKKSDAVRVTTFTGCMGETFLDSKPIGLWNFRDIEGDCKGCAVSPQVADGEGTVQFDGDSYAMVSRPIRWNPNISTVMFKFRTFSSNALLMYLATDDLKDFMSVELSGGRIKVSYDLGSGTASVISNQNHNDGKWKSFTLSRIQKQGEFLWCQHHDFPSYLCRIFLHFILFLLILLMFLPVLFFLQNIYTVSFPKPGFVELQPVSFDLGTEINLSFSTRNESGIILFGTSGTVVPPRRKRRYTGREAAPLRRKLTIEFEVRTTADSGLLFYMARINHADFATVQIKNGLPYFSYDLGSGDTNTMISNKINDGQWHKIKVIRMKQEGNLIVDDISNKTASPKKADILDVVGMLYVGGLPINYTTRRIGPVTYSIDGCIRSFKMTESPVDLDNPTSSFNVGKCFVTAQKGTYFDGTGFAKTVGSYKVGTDLLVEFEFRTTRMNGVLLGVSSQKMDGLGIELVDGKVMFHVDNGAGRFSAIYEPDAPGSLCDGQWHKVLANKIKHRLELTVDDRQVDGNSPNRASTSADTNDPVFVGGYPGEHLTHK